MLMIHGGHGWLINQFLSPLFNHREDEYGGCLENRCRFAVEVLQAVRRAVGGGFPIEFRMSGAELVEGGYDLEEGIRIAKQLEPYIDLLHVSAGTYQKTFGQTHPSMFTEHGCNVYLAAEIRHVSVPVAAIGGLSEPCADGRGLSPPVRLILFIWQEPFLQIPFCPGRYAKTGKLRS